ncbi:MAG: NAD+ synthase [Steroidobacteraceae bacterium]
MSASRFKLALAQQNFRVGDVAANLLCMQQCTQVARDARADLIVFPELALVGYPPEDLLFHRGLRARVDAALQQLAEAADGIALLTGYPEYSETEIYNTAVVFSARRELVRYRKQQLPNYQVFDEKRYFRAGDQTVIVEIAGVRIGMLICEDIWHVAPAAAARAAGAELLLAINASPFEVGKQPQREDELRQRVKETGLPFVYLNLVGGQDELVFDGGSVVIDAQGDIALRAAAFESVIEYVEFERDTNGKLAPIRAQITPIASDDETIYEALVLGVRDYVDKHGFPGVVLGLSGGIDSALTLAIAVDALGAERVQAVMMPSRYTSGMSVEDAALQARRLGVKHSVIPIESVFETALRSLREEFAGRSPDTTEENLQSRCRMLFLMGISNKTGRMLLTTGNKSEMAVGYATLYGDMAGGYAPIKDCSKLRVYRLAAYRNSLVASGESPVIPQRVIEREPSAELRPDQKDVDSLPPYEVLDPILEAFIEEDCSVEEIVARGFERETVLRVLGMVRRNEYKRRQAPPGVRISRRAFGRDWRYPITNGYRN